MSAICPRCSKNVYFAEEKRALGKRWHKLCFVCGRRFSFKFIFAKVVDGVITTRFRKVKKFQSKREHLKSKVVFLINHIALAICKKSLDSGSISERDGDMFCDACYRKNFGPKGYGFGGGLSLNERNVIISETFSKS
jgi:cysteine/glycine-rich protein